MNGNPQIKQCPQCGNMDSVAAGFCSRCGQKYPPYSNTFLPPTPQTTGLPPRFGSPDTIQLPPGAYDPTLAIVLAVIFSGWIGMIINKQQLKGVVVLVAGIFLILATGGLGVFVVYPLSLVDVILIGNRLKRGEPVAQWQWF